MKTESELRAEGMSLLINALGPVEAERFVASMSREHFDYTEWRRTHMPKLNVAQIHEAASQLKKQRGRSRVEALCSGVCDETA
jgi:hypothetical protein